jgi:hypothetical protein
MLSIPRLYKPEPVGNLTASHAVVGSNTSTIAVRVIGYDEKGTQCLVV